MHRTRRPSPYLRLKEQRELLDNWSHPSGTPVKVRRDDGTILHTKTRSLPWMIGDVAVIAVEGISGGYALERVTLNEP